MPTPPDFNRDQYTANYQDYLNSNTDGRIGGGSVNDRIELFKNFVSFDSKVLEIGSGGGDDALALKSAGYKVTASDYVDKFLELLKQKGLDAMYLDAKTDELPEVDAIYANAVFVHFSPGEIATFLQKAEQKLQGDKIIFASVIKGEGHERSARSRSFERDFYYYTLDTMADICMQSGFEVVYSNDFDPKWLQVIMKAN